MTATQPVVDRSSRHEPSRVRRAQGRAGKGRAQAEFAFAGVAIGLTSFIVLRVVLNPWGVNPSGAETQRVKGAKTERERQAEIHALENAERERHRR